MVHRRKTYLSVLLVISCSMLFSQTISLQLQIVSGDAQAFRYQLNSRDESRWCVNAADDLIISFQADDRGTDRVYLESTEDGRQWEDCAVIVYDHDAGIWVAEDPDAACSMETVSLRVQTLSGPAAAYRYMLAGRNQGIWQEVPADTSLISFQTSDRENELILLEYTDDLESWLPCAEISYDLMTDRWQVSDAEHVDQELRVSSVMIDSGAMMLLPVGDLRDHYGNEYGGLVRFSKDSTAALGWFGELSYGMGLSNDARVDLFHDLGAGIGGSYTLEAGPATFRPYISGGLLLHMPDYAEGTSGDAFYIDEYGSLALQAAVSVSRSWDLFAESRLLVFPEQDRIGMLAGLHTGISVEL